MKSIANYISIARMFLAFTLVLVKPLSIEFFIIYFVCGISDIADGYIARKTDTISKLGGKLDSVADLIMVMILIIIIYPIINLTVEIVVWVVIIGIIRAISMIMVFIKYKTFAIIHTYSNKMTGLILFAFPLLLVFEQPDLLLMYILCIVASISAIEEFCIHLSSKELEINRKSILAK